MEVVDLTEHFYQCENLWNDTLDFIRRSDDRLKNNYLDIDPQSYICFTALIDKNKIICFSSLQSDPLRWGDKIARCSTRMWVHPNYRFQGMTKFTKGPRFLNSYYCLPLQLSRAKELGYDCVFMSRDANKKGFEAWTDLVNENCQSDFKLLDDRYNLCGDFNDGSSNCVQYVSVDVSNDLALNIWKNAMHNKIIKD